MAEHTMANDLGGGLASQDTDPFHPPAVDAIGELANEAIPVVAIIGPTATGKSALGIALAEHIGGEIVNADSRQVYRRMDIGTAKPSADDRSRVPHHLFDIVEPDEPFSLAEYLLMAREAVRQISSNQRLPIVVGGSGLYLRALLDGLLPPAVPPNPKLRDELQAIAGRDGPDALTRELARADPVAAARIDPRNVRRLVRAIEVVRATGSAFSEAGTVHKPPYAVRRIGLTMTRDALYQQIDRRVDAMFEAGLVQEVARLLEAGFRAELPSMSSLGYPQVTDFLAGKLSLPDAVQTIKYRTHQFARRQYTWFRIDDPRTNWLQAGEPNLVELAVALAQSPVPDQATISDSP